MNTLILSAHSIMRWVVLVLALLAIVRGVSGWMGNKPWTNSDRKAGLFLMIAADIQLLLGVILYFFISDITRRGMDNMSMAMKDTTLRFWTVEHFSLMFLAIFLIHLGKTLSNKAEVPVKKHKLAAVFFIISLVLILAGIPWPGTPNGRPLF